MQTFRKLPTTAPNAPAATSRARRQRVDHERGRSAAAGSSGSGQSGDDCDSCDAAVRSSSIRRAGRDRAGRRGSTPARDQRRPVAAAAPVAPREVVDGALQRVDLVERVAAAAAGARRPAAASRFPPSARIAVHIARDDRRSPPCASVVAASERSHHGAPGTSAPSGTTRRPRGSRGDTSSDEADVLHVLPLVGLLAQPLLEQRDRQIGPAGAARDTARPGRSTPNR